MFNLKISPLCRILEGITQKGRIWAVEEKLREGTEIIRTKGKLS